MTTLFFSSSTGPYPLPLIENYEVPEDSITMPLINKLATFRENIDAGCFDASKWFASPTGSVYRTTRLGLVEQLHMERMPLIALEKTGGQLCVAISKVEQIWSELFFNSEVSNLKKEILQIKEHLQKQEDEIRKLAKTITELKQIIEKASDNTALGSTFLSRASEACTTETPSESEPKEKKSLLSDLEILKNQIDALLSDPFRKERIEKLLSLSKGVKLSKEQMVKMTVESAHLQAAYEKENKALSKLLDQLSQIIKSNGLSVPVANCTGSKHAATI